MPGEPAREVPIQALGPVVCATTAWRSRGELHLTVIVKATFALAPGVDMAQVAPEPILRAEVHHAHNPVRSVRLTSDLAPFLPRADVLFTGHAHAPGGRPAAELSVRLAVHRGPEALLDKRLRVFGGRAKGDPPAFDKLPLVWERAFGGIGWDPNPVGVGFRKGEAPPSVVDPEDPGRSSCFAPISRTWPTRRRLLGTASRKALEAPVGEIPDALDPAYFQAAPADQRTDFLRGGEWLTLENLHPEVARLKTRLPDARAEARLWGLDPADATASRDVELTADTLRIDGDAEQCSLTWRGSVVVPSEAALGGLRGAAGVSLGGEPIAWPRPERTAIWSPADLSIEAADESDFAATLVKADAPGEAPELGHTRALSPADAARAATKASLPFAREIAAPPARAPEPTMPWVEGTIALAPDEAEAASKRPETPFARASTPPPPPSSAGPIPGAPWSSTPARPAPAILDEETVGLRVAEPEPAPEAAAAAQFFHRAERRDPADSITSITTIPRRSSDAIPVCTRAPLVAFTLPWQMTAAREARVVILKGTFDLVSDGPAALRDDPDPPSGDVHLGDDTQKSLSYASDFALFKPRADVTLVGHAHAPKGLSATALVAFRFGRGEEGFHRRIAVFGDRRWQDGLLDAGPTPPRRFETMPLVYERAFGGPESDENPIGIGHGPGFTLLPNLEDPDHRMERPGDTAPAAVFAPIPMGWRARWSKIGTYDARWQKTRWPFFPDDFDWSFFNAAPRAQQLEAIEGDEPFAILGMDPDEGRIEGTLPALRPRCFAQRTTAAGGLFHEVALRLDTAAFDADQHKVNLLWRGLVEVEDEDASDVAELFVMIEPMAGPRAALGEAEAKYRAERTRLGPMDEGEAANDGEASTANDAHAQRIRDRLRAAGILDPSAAAAAPPPARSPAARGEERTPIDTGPPQRARDDDPVRARVRALLAGGTPLAGLDFAGADLSDLDFSSRSLVGVNLAGANLARCRFTGADLSHAQLARADLTAAVLDGASLELCDLSSATLTGASFAGASVGRANFAGARGDRAVFTETRGEHPSFVEGSWTGARFDRAEMEGADFTRTAIAEASFEGARMPGIKLYDAQGERVSFKDAELTDAGGDGARLPRSIFAGAFARASVWDKADLEEASFLGATLTGASFARASCARAIFSGADLTEGRLGRANLRAASLLKTNLLAASLEGADLSDADLRGANLHGAETWRARFDRARLELAILTQTKLGGRS